jgi:hypothetical protein
MATRKHSIRVPVNFGAVADLVSAVPTTIGTPTIYIPENNSAAVTFTSVLLFTGMQDTLAAGGATVSVYTVSVTLAPAAASSVAVVSGNLANTGENWGGIVGPIDYTTYFNTNYGAIGTISKAATVAVQSTVSAGATRGVYGYFEITYTFDDAQTTRIQTICVPYESQLSTITNTANTTFCTIPQLTGVGGILAGYAGVTIRNRWMEVRGNSNTTAATNFNLAFRFDTGATINFPTRECGSNAAAWQFYQADASALTTTATHTFQLWNATAAIARFANVIVNEWITFEYTVSGTTSVLNYVELAAEFTSPLPGTTNAVDLVIQRDLLINEPTPISFVKGALEVCYTAAVSCSIAVSAGAQAAAGRTYAMAFGTLATGMYSFQHGLDSSSALGAALTLARGENAITISMWRTVGAAYNVSGTIKILYSSGVASGGVDTHNRTCWELARSMNFTTQTDDTVTNESFQIPETSYWLNAAGLKYLMWNTAAANYLTSQVRVLAGETPGDGWRDLYSDYQVTGPELGYIEWSVRGRDVFKNYPQDQDSSQMDIETARNLRSTAVGAIRYGVKWTVSYTAITFQVAGTISGSGGGSITIDLFQISNRK